jgi:hypothetical protein
MFLVHCTASFTLELGTIYSNKFQMILHIGGNTASFPEQICTDDIQGLVS